MIIVAFIGRRAMRSTLTFLLLAITMATAGPAGAQQKFENLDRLDSLVAVTVGANIGQPGGPAAAVDRRLRLAPCPQTPSVEGPVFGAAMVKCDSIGWRIRVPLVPGGANVAATSSVRAATRTPVSRDIIVKKGDPVELQAGGSAFTVSRVMIADEDGAAGQMIRVREDKKAPVVIAQVWQMGIVRAPGFKE
jgi:flagella basal body P-ring formation protein FlgA